MQGLLFAALVWALLQSGTTASLRGVAAVDERVAWVSGSDGTWLRTTDGGAAWSSGRVPDAETLDFRDVHAVSASAAFLLASGPGDQSRIYKTMDGGKTWLLQFRNPDPTGFLDALAFWDDQRGLVLGDPVDGRFAVFATDDGGIHWERRVGPAAMPKEGAFAASGTCLIVTSGREAWFGTGGARVFHSTDGGRTWAVVQTPIRHDGSGAGVFSLTFADARHGIAVGGDYTKPDLSEHNIAVTSDGGLTWNEPRGRHPRGYRSAVAYVPALRAWIAVGTSGSDISHDNGENWQAFGSEPFNAVAFATSGKSWAVGPKGAIAVLGGRQR